MRAVSACTWRECSRTGSAVASVSCPCSSCRNSHVTSVKSPLNESVPIQLAQCWLYGLAISNAKYKYIFQIKTYAYGSNFIKQHSETCHTHGLKLATCRTADCSLKNTIIVSFIIIFGRLSFQSRLDNLYWLLSSPGS